jgi:signal transduction histidine kinase
MVFRGMRINRRIIIVFSLIIVATIASVSYVSFRTLEAAVIDSQIKEMQNEVEIRANLVESLHSRASEDILFAVKNPVFTNYFDLPETREGNNFDENGVVQFTPQQRALKTEMEQWIYAFQSKFDVDETCVIHTPGQEQARLVLGEIAPDDELSPSEGATPFYAPSLQLEKDEVYVQSPYVSPDTGRWVFAYTTPIVLSDGTKPSFFHFEMPMNLFEDLLTPENGRMYVVDGDGRVFGDSANRFSNEVGSATFGTKPEEFFPHVNSISDSGELVNIVTATASLSPGEKGTGIYQVSGESHYVTYEKLPTFGWVLVYEKPYSLMLTGNTNLSQLGFEIAIVSFIVGAAGLSFAFIVSSRISKPITRLASALRSQEIGNLKKVETLNTSDEVSEVTIAINDMVTKINSLEKQKDEFASMITHELRTPLTPIVGWCQALKNPKMTGGTLNPKQEEAVETIRKNAKRLQGLIGDMLDAQKLDMNRMQFNNEEFVAHDLIKETMQNFQDAMTPKKIEFQDSTSSKDVSIRIKSDKGRIVQVLSNLVVNAVDFVQPKTGRIEIGMKDQDTEVTFYVKDNGVGIPQDKQQHLFTKFYQVDTSMTRKHGGSGLGLAICRGIIESLGGRIWVESKPGKGAAFYFTIPKLESINAGKGRLLKEQMNAN